MSMGSSVLMPWPISGPRALMVTVPSGAILMKAVGFRSPFFAGLGLGGRDVETEGEASAGQGGDFQKGAAVEDRRFMGSLP